MDTNDTISSIDTFEQFIAQEDLCADIANTRLQEINKYIEDSEDILNQSRNCIEDSFKNIIHFFDQWKKEFVVDLESAVKDQLSTLLQERDSLKENITKFNKFMFSAKINVKACPDSQRENTALNFLHTLSPIVKTLLEENFYQPITFVTNKDFLKSFFKLEDKHKIGYIRYLPVEVGSLKLEPPVLKPCVGSSARVVIRTSDHDLDGLSQFFSWKVVAEDKVIQASLNEVDNAFILQFPVSNNVHYEVNFFLFNQHISGSPCTILPVFQQEPSRFVAHIFENKPELVPMKVEILDQPVKGPVKLVDRSSFSIKPPRTLNHLHNSKVNNVNVSAQHNDIKNPLEKLELHASPSYVAPISTKLVDRTYISVVPPRALAHHNKRLISVDMDHENEINRLKESTPNGDIKLSEKLIDRSVKIPKAAAIRKPFCSLKKIENKVNNDGNRIRDIKMENPIESEFKPLFSSTSEVIAAHATSMANASSNDVSLEPGQKTLLLNECLLKTPYAPSSPKFLIDANNNCNSSQLKMELVKDNLCTSTVFNSINNNKEHIRSNNDNELTDTEDKSFHTFLKMDLIAKCQACFTGNDKMQMKLPIGIAELLNGNIVVADTFNDRLLLFSKDAIFISEFNGSKRLSQPSAIDILPGGQFAVRDNHSIITFSENCQPLKTLGNKFLSKPYGITHDTDGNIITIDVSHNGNFSIVKMDPLSGKLLSRVNANVGSNDPGSKLSKPRFITFRKPNELLVVDLGLDFVYIIDMNTGQLITKFGGSGTVPGKFSDPSGIACDAEGYIFIGDSRNHRIQVFTPEGNFVCVLKVDRPLKRPSGLHLTSAGQLYVLNYWENSFVKYSFTVDKPKQN